MNKPTTAFAGLPIGGSPSMSHLPNRGPIVLAATNAIKMTLVFIDLLLLDNYIVFLSNDGLTLEILPEVPPIRCTPPLPAMSTTPK